MRIPGGALLIALGLFFLWVAVTGKIERFNAAWNYVKGSSDLPDPEAKPQVQPISNLLNKVVDPASWHMNQTAMVLDPVVSLTMAGGV